MKKILIAGIGNIFFGDDAFGGEVVKLLQNASLPENVKLFDFGTRTRDLAYELCENYDLVIFIDAVRLGNPDGTVVLVEFDPNDFDESQGFVSHEARLEETLKFARTLGAVLPQIYLVGAEPESLDHVSEAMKNSVVKAAEMVKNLLNVISDQEDLPAEYAEH